MRGTTSRSILHLLFVLVSITQTVWSTRASEIDTIREGFEKNSHRLNEVIVTWQQVPEPAKLNEGIQVKTKCTAAAKGEKRFYDARYEPLHPPAMQGAPSHIAMSFDGKETRILDFPEHANIWPGDEQRQFGAPDNFLALQGYPKSNFRVFLGKAFAGCNFADLLKDPTYHLAGKEMVDGRRCVVVQGPSDRLVLDPARGYALIRRELAPQDPKGQYTFTFRDFDEVFPGFWLARAIDQEVSRPGEIVRSHLTVTELRFNNVPDDLFSLKFEPGTTVEDVRHFKADPDGTIPFALYRIPAKPADLDAVVAAAVERHRAVDAAGEQGRMLRYVILLVNAVVVVLLALILYRRRLQRA